MSVADIKGGLIDLWNTDMGDWSIDLGNPMILVASALLLASLLLTLWLSWRRLYPASPPRAVMVALLNLVAFSVVLALLIEPQRLHQVEHAVTLITEGTDMPAASLPDGASVYVSPGMLATPETLRNLKNANWLLDIAQLQLRETALASIDVRGFGLNRTQWQSLPADIRVSFQAPQVIGFTEMHWPRTLVAGETLHLGGRYSDQAAVAVLKLRLLDPAGNISAEVRAKNNAHFSLSARPRGRGNLTYTLQAWSGDKLLSEQAVATSVGTAGAINIMVEQSAPSFETRQLKNYAAGNGAQVLINTQISRGKNISQSANLPDNAEITFSPQTLAQQDVLIMDGRALINLANQQRQWLAEAITGGLGLLLLADASLLEEFGQLRNGLLKGFELTSNPDAQAEAVPRMISNPASDWQQPLPIAPIQLQATDADILIDDGYGRALVLNKAKGLGHVAISLINQSHRWLTAGHRENWSEYWSTLIASVGRPRSDSYLLPQTDHSFFKAGERTPVCAMSTTDILVATVIPVSAQRTQSDFDIPLTADELGSPRLCGWFWPQNSGWHQVQLSAETGGEVHDQQGFFILDRQQWLSQSRYERVVATRKRVSDNTARQTSAGAEKWVREPLDVFWLYILLVTSASLLWLERKQFYFP